MSATEPAESWWGAATHTGEQERRQALNLAMRAMERDMIAEKEWPLDRRMGEQLNRDEFSDCAFLVDGREIPAHRIVLAATSPVFRAMLSHRWQSSEIVITDIDYNIFMDLLQYSYSDNLKIVSAFHACELLYAFNKYMIHDASKICKKFIKTELSMDNCVQLYMYCNNICEEDLSNSIVTYICEHIDIVVKEQLDMFNGTLWRSIFSAEHVNMTEIELIGHLYEWSLLACKKDNLKTTYENIRRILDRAGITKLIRILSLDISVLKHLNGLSGLLRKSEIEYIKSHMNEYEDKNASNDNINLCSRREPRLSIPSSLVSSIRLSRSNQSPLSISKSRYRHAVKIKTDRTIVLRGITIPTQTRPLQHCLHHYYILSDYTEDIKITIVESNSNANGECYKHIIKEDTPYETTALVTLPAPYTLKKNVWYTMTFQWESFAKNPNECAVLYYYANSRCVSTSQVANIKYIDSNENSFLIGMRYSV